MRKNRMYDYGMQPIKQQKQKRAEFEPKDIELEGRYLAGVRTAPKTYSESDIDQQYRLRIYKPYENFRKERVKVCFFCASEEPLIYKDYCAECVAGGWIEAPAEIVEQAQARVIRRQIQQRTEITGAELIALFQRGLREEEVEEVLSVATMEKRAIAS